jgi:hypothetical protein
MSMHIHKLATYLRPEEASTLIEFLDQLREMLMQAYGDDVTAMLQQASGAHESRDWLDEDEPF